MQISLDNINFYQPHPPNFARSTSVSAWKRYDPLPVPRFLEYTAPTRHPIAAATPTSTGSQKNVQQPQVHRTEHPNSQAAPPRNAFDVELEEAAAENNQFMSDEMDDDYRFRNECALHTGMRTDKKEVYVLG